MNINTLKDLLIISGAGHIAVSLGGLLIPIAMKWKLHLKNLQPLLRQMFWTYAVYILMVNISFGLICLLGTVELLNGTFLATSLNLMISGYWLIRIGIQFLYFDRTYAPKGILYTLGEFVLVALFILFSAIHLIVLFHD